MGVDTTKDIIGLEAMGDYATTPASAAIDVLLALIDTPDATMTHRGFLDEMSPAARAQLLVELNAMSAVIGTWNTAV